MENTHSIFKPEIRFLSDRDKESIYQSALEVIGQVGMRVLHDGALDLLKQAGCRVGEDSRVTLPEDLVKQSIASAPDNIPVFDRQGRAAMDLGGRRAYFGTGSDLMYSLDAETGNRRTAVLEDVKTAARLCDALPNIDFIMSCGHPSDIPPRRAYLESVAAMAGHSVKPIVCTAEGRNDLSEMWEICSILRGGEELLKEKPYIIHYAEPISPLTHPFNSLDKLMFCAEKGLPAIYSPAPIAGSTAPMTIAGHVVQGLAESFFGLVIHQLTRQGAPFLMGMGAAVLDMATSQCSYNAPEYYLAYMGMIEMSHYFNLPSWGYAGTSDSQVPDGQATLESGMMSFLSIMSGANLNHDVGYLDFGLTGSLEMIVISDEFIDQFRRMASGIPVDPDTMGVQAIREVGPSGHFLTHPHTLKHLRSTQWRPQLICRDGYEKWRNSGLMTLLDRAKKRVKTILDTHDPTAIPEDQARQIRQRLKAFEGKIGEKGNTST